MDAGRTELPDRRLTLTSTIHHKGTWHLSAGFDRAGKLREIFLDGLTVDGVRQGQASELCVLMSHALQRDREAVELAEGLAGNCHPMAPLVAIALLEAAGIALVEADAIALAYRQAEGVEA